MSFWLSNGYSMTSTPDFATFNDLLGEGSDGSNTKIINIHDDLRNLTGIPDRLGPFYGTKLRYAAISVNLSLSYSGLGYVEGLPVYDAWEDFMERELAQMPYELQRGFQTNVNQWHWLKVCVTPYFYAHLLHKNSFRAIALQVLRGGG